jgi:outer membrane lipoprotein-sorting protein
VIIKRLADADINVVPSHIFAAYLEKYTYTLKEKKGAITVVQWKPDSSAKSSELQGIQLSIDTKNSAITGLELIDKSGNESTYLFRKTKFSTKFSKETFDYAAPKEASVLDMRK